VLIAHFKAQKSSFLLNLGIQNVVKFTFIILVIIVKAINMTEYVLIKMIIIISQSLAAARINALEELSINEFHNLG